MRKFFNAAVTAVLVCMTVVFTACSFGGAAEKTVIVYTNDLKSAVNLALRSSVVIQTSYAKGSGVIYEIDGSDMYIITNWHVIAKDSNGANNDPNDDANPAGGYAVAPAGAYRLTGSGQIEIDPQYRAETNAPKAESNDEDDVKLVGGSSYYDIAVLKVTNTDLIDRFNLTQTAVFGGRTAYGDAAFAIGNALGMDISVTDGIISVPSEYIVEADILPGENGEKIYMERRVIRTTAAVQQGNSGGGLFNGAGELVGIVQSKPFYTGEVGSTVRKDNLPIDNIAYAVPTDVAVRIAKQMVERDRAGEFTGVYSQDCLLIPTVGITLTGSNKRADSTATDAVYYIEDVAVNEIANACNVDLVTGDIIRKVVCDGKELNGITQVYQIREFLIECYNADRITFFVERSGIAGLLELTGGFVAGQTGDRP